MKKLLTAILLLNFTVSFSQGDKDLTEIIELIITEYQTDTLMVHNRFNNDGLLSALYGAKTRKDKQIHNKYGNEFDSNGIDANWERKSAEIFDDTITVRFENMEVEIYLAISIVDKKHNKRIRPYTRIKLKKNRRIPVAYISFPILSTNRKKAIIYGARVCGALCGSGGVFYFEKINGKWQLVKYEERWIS